MDLIKNKTPTKCDTSGCEKLAEYKISAGVIFGKKINCCKTCLEKLYIKIASEVVPKSPQNFVDRAEKNQRRRFQ